MVCHRARARDTSIFKIPLLEKRVHPFPGDIYKTATIFIWFDYDTTPSIKLSQTISVPRGYIVTLSKLRSISPNTFYSK